MCHDLSGAVLHVESLAQGAGYADTTPEQVQGNGPVKRNCGYLVQSARVLAHEREGLKCPVVREDADDNVRLWDCGSARRAAKDLARIVHPDLKQGSFFED